MKSQTLIASVLHKYLTGTLWAAVMGWPNKALQPGVTHALFNFRR